MSLLNIYQRILSLTNLSQIFLDVKSHPIIPLVEYVQIEPDIIRMFMEIVFKHRQVTIQGLQGLRLFVEMEHIVLVKVAEEHVRIMEESLNGTINCK